MKHITIGIYGDSELARKLGKKGSENDITIFNHGSSEGIFTYVCSNSDKIQTLLQTLNMIDFPVIVVKELDKSIAEIMIAIDEMGFAQGFIISSVDIGALIKGTSLENFKIIEESQIREELLNVDVEHKGKKLMIPIDNYFNVKSVGTVILGIMKSGAVKKYDKVMVEPAGKEVVVKGIQSQDRDIEQAEAGMRVGLNLKGIEADELRRGYYICQNMNKSDTFRIKLKKNKFFRQELKPGVQVFLNIGLQVVTSVIDDIKQIEDPALQNHLLYELKLKTNVAVAYNVGMHCIIASQNDILPRIIGSGVII